MVGTITSRSPLPDPYWVIDPVGTAEGAKAGSLLLGLLPCTHHHLADPLYRRYAVISHWPEPMVAEIPAACGATSSGFSPVYYLLFQLSLTVLCTIGQWSILSLDDGSPFLP